MAVKKKKAVALISAGANASIAGAKTTKKASREIVLVSQASEQRDPLNAHATNLAFLIADELRRFRDNERISEDEEGEWLQLTMRTLINLDKLGFVQFVDALVYIANEEDVSQFRKARKILEDICADDLLATPGFMARIYGEQDN
jgi:hypothetical protein